MLPADCLHLPHNLGITNEAAGCPAGAVHHLDGNARTLRIDHLPLRHAGQICRERHIQRNDVIRADILRRNDGTASAHLLLGGEYGVQVGRILFIRQQTAQCNELEYARTIIKCLACDNLLVLAHEQRGVFERYWCAHLNAHLQHLLTAGRADVNEEFIQPCRHLYTGCRTTGLHVVHHAIDVAVLGLDDDMFAKKLLGLNPCQRLEPEETMAVNRAHNETDFIQMRYNGHFRSLAGLVCDEVMQPIGGKRKALGKIAAHNRFRLLLKARRRDCLAQRDDHLPEFPVQSIAVKIHDQSSLLPLWQLSGEVAGAQMRILPDQLG